MRDWSNKAIAKIEADFQRSADQIISELNRQGETGSVVSMICDSGDRYLETYYSDDWLKQNGFDLTRYRESLEAFYDSGTMPG
jgi:cysteine synthase A